VITAVPAVMPATTPDDDPTPAIAGAPDVHTPPVGEPVRFIVAPVQTVFSPVITGVGFTVIVIEVKHPVGNVYVIVTTPGATAVTVPDAEPTVAILVLLLVQTPPNGLLVSVIISPTQRLETGRPVVPVITVGCGLTVTSVVTKQPPGSVYVIAVTPGEIPVTTPVPVIVPIPGEPDVQVPPDGDPVRVMLLPTHTVEGPVIGKGIGLTVTGTTAKQPVGNV